MRSRGWIWFSFSRSWITLRIIWSITIPISPRDTGISISATKITATNNDTRVCTPTWFIRSANNLSPWNSTPFSFGKSSDFGVCLCYLSALHGVPICAITKLHCFMGGIIDLITLNPRRIRTSSLCDWWNKWENKKKREKEKSSHGFVWVKRLQWVE